MDSNEITGWLALMEIKAEDAQDARDRAESGDGVVIDHRSLPVTEDDDGGEFAD